MAYFPPFLHIDIISPCGQASKLAPYASVLPLRIFYLFTLLSFLSYLYLNFFTLSPFFSSPFYQIVSSDITGWSISKYCPQSLTTGLQLKCMNLSESYVPTGRENVLKRLYFSNTWVPGTEVHTVKGDTILIHQLLRQSGDLSCPFAVVFFPIISTFSE